MEHLGYVDLYVFFAQDLRRSSQSPHLDFSLFLRSGFYNFHVSKAGFEKGRERITKILLTKTIGRDFFVVARGCN